MTDSGRKRDNAATQAATDAYWTGTCLTCGRPRNEDSSTCSAMHLDVASYHQGRHEGRPELERLLALRVAVNEMIRWETHSYSKDPKYWTAIRKDTYAAVLKAMASDE